MFNNKVVVITGAALGIGQGIAVAYAKKGAKVVIGDINSSKGEELSNQLKTEGYSALFVQTDVRKEEDIIHLMKTAHSYFGGINILVNNVGINIISSPYELKVSEWDDVINTNLRSTFLCSREAAKYMKNNTDGGSIVNISSTRAKMSEPNTEAYAASKGGILAITHALAASLGPDKITVNAISPGWIETGDYSSLREVDHLQHLSGRVGTPKDIAQACMYVTHPENNFVTGTNITVDGGMTKKMIYED